MNLEEELKYSSDKKHRELVDRIAKKKLNRSRALNLWVMILICAGILAQSDQALKVWTGSSEGVSLFNWSSILIEEGTWVIYAFHQKDKVLGLSSLASVILAITIIGGIIF